MLDISGTIRSEACNVCLVVVADCLLVEDLVQRENLTVDVHWCTVCVSLPLRCDNNESVQSCIGISDLIHVGVVHPCNRADIHRCWASSLRHGPCVDTLLSGIDTDFRADLACICNEPSSFVLFVVLHSMGMQRHWEANKVCMLTTV